MSSTIETIRKGAEAIREWPTEKLDERIERVDQRLDRIEHHLDSLEKGQADLGRRLVDVERDVAVVVARLEGWTNAWMT